MLQAFRNSDVLDDGCGLVSGTPGQFLLVAGEDRGGHAIEDIEVIGAQVSVSSIEGLVEDDADAIILRGTRTRVVGVHGQIDLLGVLPSILTVGHVRAVTHGVLATLLGVCQSRVGKRRVGGVAQALHEVRFGALQLDDEGVVIEDLEAAFHVARAIIVSTDDTCEEACRAQVLLRGHLPCLNEVLCQNGGAVGELTIGAELNGPLGVVSVRGNGLCSVQLSRTVSRVVSGRREDAGDDAAATGLVGVRRDQRVLGLRTVNGDNVVRSPTRRPTIGAGAARRAGGQCQTKDGGHCQPRPLEVHRDSSY